MWVCCLWRSYSHRIQQRREERSWPVIDGGGLLVGRITIDDVVDAIIEDTEEAVLARAELDVDEDEDEDEDTVAPVHKVF